MTTKFRKTGKTKNYFPIVQHRFKTDKHPVLDNSLKSSNKVRLKLSHAECLMLEGLSNCLQEKDNEAIRIALYELTTTWSEEPIDSIEKALALTKVPNFKKRDTLFNLKIPTTELESVKELAKQWELSPAELTRTAIIWLSQGIKNQTIKRITKSPKISQDKLAEKWREKNYSKDKESTLSPLRTAHKDAYDNAVECRESINDRLYVERGSKMRQMIDSGELSTYCQNKDDKDVVGIVDDLIRAEADAAFDELIEKKTKDDLITYWTKFFIEELDLTYAEAKKAAEDTVSEEDESISDEELDEFLSMMDS